MLTIALALSVSMIVGVADFLGGTTSRRLPPLVVIGASQCVSMVLLLGATVIRGDGPPSAAFVPWAMAAAVCGIVSLGTLYRGLSSGPMGVVAPIAMLSTALPVAVGIASGERPRAAQVAGLVVALVGLALIASEAQRGGAGAPPGWLRLALITAVATGVWIVVMREASRRGDPLWAVVTFRATEISLLVVAAMVAGTRVPDLREHRGSLLTLGLLEALSVVLFAVALQDGLVSVVAVLASLYPVVTAVAAHVVLGERLDLRQRAAAGVIVGGVLLVAAGS